LKTGNMRLDIRETRQAKKPLAAEQQQAIKGKDQDFPHTLEIGEMARPRREHQWRHLVCQHRTVNSSAPSARPASRIPPSERCASRWHAMLWWMT